MGERATTRNGIRELEELYLGIPDDSVNLTFQDLAEVKQQHATSVSDKNKRSSPPVLMEPISETNGSTAHLAKLPSLDFNRAIEASKKYQNHRHPTPYNHHHHHRLDEDGSGVFRASHGRHGETHDMDHHHHDVRGSPYHHASPHGGFSMTSYDDMSGISMNPYPAADGGGRRRRPGVPHSNICTVCSTSVYFFRTRCLVCGRVYCQQCVRIGMGEMAEGRKCLQCLGRRLSQRYIQRAGQMGCCMGYASTVKLQELKWAEKGPRKSGENRYDGRSGMISTSRSPITPRSPTGSTHLGSNTPSFVANSPYSHYSSTSHHLPL